MLIRETVIGHASRTVARMFCVMSGGAALLPLPSKRVCHTPWIGAGPHQPSAGVRIDHAHGPGQPDHVGPPFDAMSKCCQLVADGLVETPFQLQ